MGTKKRIEREGVEEGVKVSPAIQDSMDWWRVLTSSLELG